MSLTASFPVPSHVQSPSAMQCQPDESRCRQSRASGSETCGREQGDQLLSQCSCLATALEQDRRCGSHLREGHV